MRKFNVQVAAALFTIFIVLGSGSYVAHEYQLRRNAYAFMRQADRWEEQAERAVKRGNLKQARQDYVSASKCLKAYVYLMPYDVDALEKCGMLMADIAQRLSCPRRGAWHAGACAARGSGAGEGPPQVG